LISCTTIGLAVLGLVRRVFHKMGLAFEVVQGFNEYLVLLHPGK
jgi:hypothetical protein